MDDELTPEQRFAAEDAETLVPRALLLGRRPEDVVGDLVKLDWSRAAAESLVARVIEDMRQFRASAESRQRLIDNAFKQFLGGLMLGFVGLVAMGLGFAIYMVGAMGRFILFAIPFGVFACGLGLAGRGWSR